jgi:hypothetical protein
MDLKLGASGSGKPVKKLAIFLLRGEGLPARARLLSKRVENPWCRLLARAALF